MNSNDPQGLCVINGQEYPDPCFDVTGTGAAPGAGPGGGGGGDGRSSQPGLDLPNPDVYPNPPILTIVDLGQSEAVNALRHKDCDDALSKSGGSTQPQTK